MPAAERASAFLVCLFHIKTIFDFFYWHGICYLCVEIVKQMSAQTIFKGILIYHG